MKLTQNALKFPERANLEPNRLYPAGHRGFDYEKDAVIPVSPVAYNLPCIVAVSGPCGPVCRFLYCRRSNKRYRYLLANGGGFVLRIRPAHSRLVMIPPIRWLKAKLVK